MECVLHHKLTKLDHVGWRRTYERDIQVKQKRGHEMFQIVILIETFYEYLRRNVAVGVLEIDK